jgi:hypothetical protein
MARAPYPKPRPSQHRTPAFYWRGSDILREREYLADEYKKALTNYRRAELELRTIEQELQQAHETLHEREGYTTALANYLDADTEGNHMEQEYKRRLMKVEAEIRKAQADLQAAKAVHHPAAAANLLREKAYLQIELQRTEKALELTREQDNSERRKLSQIAVSERFQTSWDLETKAQDLNRKHQFLRGLVTNYKKAFDAERPFPVSQSDEARLERAAYSALVEANYWRGRSYERARRRPGKWNAEIDRLLVQLEKLNERMTELEMPEDRKVDMEEMRSRFRPGEKQSGGQEEENTKAEDGSDGVITQTADVDDDAK